MPTALLLSIILLLSCQVEPNPINVPSYSRSEWNHWVDSDGDCQNLRHELLIAQSLIDVSYTGMDQCYVRDGKWLDPYSNQYYQQASDLDIDHVVPLAYAHQAGGYRWSDDAKERFANDPDNLLIVDDGINQSKGSKGPADFVPEYSQCEYARIWLLVSEKYELLINEPDLMVIDNIMESCE